MGPGGAVPRLCCAGTAIMIHGMYAADPACWSSSYSYAVAAILVSRRAVTRRGLLSSITPCSREWALVPRANLAVEARGYSLFSFFVHGRLYRPRLHTAFAHPLHYWLIIALYSTCTCRFYLRFYWPLHTKASLMRGEG